MYKYFTIQNNILYNNNFPNIFCLHYCNYFLLTNFFFYIEVIQIKG